MPNPVSQFTPVQENMEGDNSKSSESYLGTLLAPENIKKVNKMFKEDNISKEEGRGIKKERRKCKNRQVGAFISRPQYRMTQITWS